MDGLERDLGRLQGNVDDLIRSQEVLREGLNTRLDRIEVKLDRLGQSLGSRISKLEKWRAFFAGAVALLAALLGWPHLPGR